MKRFPLLLTVSLLAACNGQTPPPADNATAPSDPGNAAPVEVPANAASAETPTVPALPPAANSAAPETDSAAAAADVVRRYFALIGAGKYHDAWALWDDNGKASGMSAEAFAASFERYATFEANVGAPGRVDAGAGQRYVTVPVEVRGTLRSGAGFRMGGPVTLHRVGDIDGATPAQKSWHIRSASSPHAPTLTVAAQPGLPRASAASTARTCVPNSTMRRTRPCCGAATGRSRRSTSSAPPRASGTKAAAMNSAARATP